MEKSSCFLDIYYNLSINFIGNKNIDILSFGREKYRLSVILAITGDWYKLPIFVIFRREEGKTIKKKLSRFILF